MAWVGVILCRALAEVQLYCFEWDEKRQRWELPKGGAELMEPRPWPSTGYVDSSPFATARAELWEEAGIWLEWREWGSFAWLDRYGNVLIRGLEEGRSGWLYTRAQENDTVIHHASRTWMTLEEYRRQRMRRNEHVDLLERVEASAYLQFM